nr:Uncharacterised protein [Raoultella sp. NCTC 9187]
MLTDSKHIDTGLVGKCDFFQQRRETFLPVPVCVRCRPQVIMRRNCLYLSPSRNS